MICFAGAVAGTKLSSGAGIGAIGGFVPHPFVIKIKIIIKAKMILEKKRIILPPELFVSLRVVLIF